jgi:hypothetical protein
MEAQESAAGHPGSPPAPEGPSWLVEAFRGIRAELVLFLRTVVAVSVRPEAFAAEWRDRRRKTLNPLAFLGTALALSSPLTLAVAHFGRLQNEPGTLWDAFLSDQVAPYLQYVLLGIFAHGVLRVLGGKQRLISTVGMALYAGGGPAMVVDLVTSPLDLAIARLARSEDTAQNALLLGLTVASIAAANVVFFVTFARGLAGLHGVRLWRPLLALSAAYVILVLVRLVFFKMVLS